MLSVRQSRNRHVGKVGRSAVESSVNMLTIFNIFFTYNLNIFGKKVIENDHNIFLKYIS
jgi:hypothetical protein